MTHERFATICALLTLTFVLAACSAAPSLAIPGFGQADTPATDAPTLEPNPNLSPADVVKIQVEALQNNDADDSGIEMTFRFASPANKLVTGPLGRFKQLVKNPSYSPMLNHKLAEYGPLNLTGDTATQRVTIVERNGQANVYLFSLSKQTEPPCQGCWMTDSVTLVPTRQQDLKGI